MTVTAIKSVPTYECLYYDGTNAQAVADFTALTLLTNESTGDQYLAEVDYYDPTPEVEILLNGEGWVIKQVTQVGPAGSVLLGLYRDGDANTLPGGFEQA